jgi:hypothetical protein
MTARRGPVVGGPIASRRIPDRLFAEHPQATEAPAPHTAQEIATLVGLLGAAGASTIAIGHGRHATSREAATAVSDAWRGLGRTVLTTVDWPAEAASWLKSARRLVSCHPDAWVIIDNPAGWAQLAIRLAEHESWSATRTFGTASLDSPDTTALTADGVRWGMRGATATGGTWQLDQPPPAAERRPGRRHP